MLSIISILACFSGIAISGYMYFKKKSHQKLACPRERPCDGVVYSRYSKTFGISNELLGVCYFLVSLLFILLFSTNYLVPTFFVFLFKALLWAGLLFSVYLIVVQAFFLKKWCVWCLGVAVSNFVLVGCMFYFLN